MSFTSLSSGDRVHSLLSEMPTFKSKMLNTRRLPPLGDSKGSPKQRREGRISGLPRSCEPFHLGPIRDGPGRPANRVEKRSQTPPSPRTIAPDYSETLPPIGDLKLEDMPEYPHRTYLPDFLPEQPHVCGIYPCLHYGRFSTVFTGKSSAPPNPWEPPRSCNTRRNNPPAYRGPTSSSGPYVSPYPVLRSEPPEMILCRHDIPSPGCRRWDTCVLDPQGFIRAHAPCQHFPLPVNMPPRQVHGSVSDGSDWTLNKGPPPALVSGTYMPKNSVPKAKRTSRAPRSVTVGAGAVAIQPKPAAPFPGPRRGWFSGSDAVPPKQPLGKPAPNLVVNVSIAGLSLQAAA